MKTGQLIQLRKVPQCEILIVRDTRTYLPAVVHVALVAQDHLLHVRGGVLLDVPDPVLDVVEALLVGDVVDEHDAHGAAVVGRRDRAEALLARGVPDLQLDLLAVQLDRADLEVDPCQGRGGRTLACT